MPAISTASRIALFAAIASSYFTAFTSSATNVAIPQIGQEFSADALSLSWVVTAYTLSSAALLLPMGRLADIIGRKKVYLVGLVAFSITTAACLFTKTISMLIFFRLLQGASGSMIFSTANAIVTSVYPSERRGQALGLTAAATYVGLSTGPVIGGLLIESLGWRSLFLLPLSLALMACVGVVIYLKGEWYGARGETYDTAGSLLFVVGLSGALYGLSTLASNTSSKYVAVGSLALMALFVWYQQRAKTPLVPLHLYTKNTVFAMSNLAAMINYSATSALSFMLSLYLQVVLGVSPKLAGSILLAQPVMMATLSPVAGSLSDRIEPRYLATGGMLIVSGGLATFAFLSQSTPLWLITLGLAIIGIGFALFSSPNTSCIMGCVEPRFYGIASASMATMRSTGMAASMAVMTLMMAMFVGNVKLGPEHGPGLIRTFRVSYVFFAVLCLLGAVASAARGNVARPEKATGGSH